MTIACVVVVPLRFRMVWSAPEPRRTTLLGILRSVLMRKVPEPKRTTEFAAAAFNAAWIVAVQSMDPLLHADAGMVVEIDHDPEGMPPGTPAPLQSMPMAFVSAVLEGYERMPDHGCA